MEGRLPQLDVILAAVLQTTFALAVAVLLTTFALAVAVGTATAGHTLVHNVTDGFLHRCAILSLFVQTPWLIM